MNIIGLCLKQNQDDLTHLILGGRITKVSTTKTFKEEEFNQELAPKNAKIEHITNDGQKYIVMTY